jgi:hypothetical protein
VLRAPDFTGNRLRRGGTYVICFSAAWCPVTRRFVPRFVTLNGKLPATLAIADITDLEDPLWDDFQIRITPSILVFHDGGVVRRFDGRRFIGITAKHLEGLEQALAAR